IASGSWDHWVRLWDAASGESCAKLPHPGIVWSLAFGPDGSWLVSTGDEEAGLLIWDVATARLRRKIPVSGKLVNSVAVSPDGATIAVTTWDAKARRHGARGASVIDIATGREVFSAEGVAFAYSPDGKWLASRAAEENILLLWDWRTQQVAGRFGGHE